MNKKYELIESDIEGLFRIKALRSFRDVQVGEIGGYIEKEENLSHCDNCWIYHDAKVFDNARVYENAKICENIEVYGHAEVFGNGKVYGHAKVFSDAKIYGKAEVSGNAKVYDNAFVFGNAKVYGDSEVCQNAEIYGNTKINKGIYTGVIDEEFKNILYIQCEKRLMTVYKDMNDVIKCNIGCQTRMTLHGLLKRIEEDGGLKEHRQECMKIMENAHLLLK